MFRYFIIDDKQTTITMTDEDAQASEIAAGGREVTRDEWVGFITELQSKGGNMSV